MVFGPPAALLRSRSCPAGTPDDASAPVWERELSARAKRSMKSSRLRDIFDICSEEAASSVELDVDCCTSSRIRSMALTTAWAPDACSSTAELISWVISLRRVVARAICEEPCRLFVGGRADFLRELVDFGDHVRDLL